MNRIVALPRSGTKFTHHLLSHLGIKSLHEGKANIPDHIEWSVSYKHLCNYHEVKLFKKTLIQIRNPLEVISSIQTIGGVHPKRHHGSADNPVRSIFDVSNMKEVEERAIVWYLNAMEKLEAISYDYLYRVEDLVTKDIATKFVSFLDFPGNLIEKRASQVVEYSRKNNKINSRPHSDIVFTKYPKYYDRIMKYIEKYNYE